MRRTNPVEKRKTAKQTTCTKKLAVVVDVDPHYKRHGINSNQHICLQKIRRMLTAIGKLEIVFWLVFFLIFRFFSLENKKPRTLKSW